MSTIYDLTVKDSNGGDLSLDQYKGKLLLVVNTASKCGFTPQYKGLEALYKKYHDAGLEVLGFPCNQFKNQEPGDAKEISTFCELNYGVTFPIMAKIDVNGESESPLFTELKNEARGILGSKKVKWNFTKFLVSRDGKKVTRYAPLVKPEELDGIIEKEI